MSNMTWDEFNLALRLWRKYGKRVKLMSPLPSGGVRLTYITEQGGTAVEKQKDFALDADGTAVEVKP